MHSEFVSAATKILFQTLKAAVACLAALLLAASTAALWGPWVALAITALIVLASLVAPSASDRGAGLIRNLGISLVIAVAVQSLAWAYIFSSQQSSDFGIYYRCGFDLQPTLAANLRSCQSQYISYGDLYWRRSLLSTVPIGWLGGGYPTLKVFNAILQGVAGLVIWTAAIRWLGALPALIAIAVFAFYPDRSFALTLATSDHAATLLCALGLASLTAFTAQRWRVRVTAALLAGVLVVALALTRSTGIFMLSSCVLVIVLCVVPRLGLRTAACCLGVLVTSILAAQVASKFVLSSAGAADGFLRLASSLDINPSGDFYWSWNWIHQFWPAIPATYQTPLALLRIWHEVVMDGMFYPAYLFSKAQTLTSGLGYVWFASADLALNKDTVRTVALVTVPFSADAALARAWSFPMLALLLAGAIRARLTQLNVAALGFFLATVGGLLFLGEVQARYMFILLPAAAFLSGAAFAPHVGQSFGLRLRDFALGSGFLGAVLALTVCAWMVARALSVPPAPEVVQYGSDRCPTRPDQVIVSSSQLSLRLLPGEVCAEAVFALRQGGHLLTFFASDGQFAYRSDAVEPTEIRYQASVDGDSVEGLATPGKVVWRQLRLPNLGPVRVSVVVRRPAEAAGRPAQQLFAYPMVWN